MNIAKLQIGFFIALTAIVLVLVVYVFLPYITPIILAGIISVVFEPVHMAVMRLVRERKSLAAFISVAIVLLVIFIPVSFFGTLLFQESTTAYEKLSSGSSSVMGVADHAVSGLQNFVQKILPHVHIDVKSYIDIESWAQGTIAWITSHLGGFFGGVAKGVLGFFIMVLALFYFFRDGKKFIASLTELSPLLDTYDGKIIRKLKTAINSVIRGQLMIALIQGSLTGLGFAIFGVPNPVLWGAIAAIASLIPTLGTSLVLIPGVLFLFLTESFIPMVGLLVWGIVAVGLIDNILGPILIERGVQIHPFLILISVIGGISLFGPIGFIVGPVVLALLFALLDIYPTILKAS